MYSDSHRRTVVRSLILILVVLSTVSGGAVASGGHDSGGEGHGGGEGHDDSHSESSLGWTISVAGLFALLTASTAPAYWFGQRIDRISGVTLTQTIAIGLITFTSAVHLYLFLEHGEAIMLLAALGFLGAIFLFFAGVNRRLLYLIGIPYIAAQIILWVSAGTPHVNSFGIIDKLAQASLLVLVSYLFWSSSEQIGSHSFLR